MDFTQQGMTMLTGIGIPVNILYNPAGAVSAISGLGAIGIAAAAAAASIMLVVGACVSAVKFTMDWGNSLYDVSLKLGVTSAQAAGLKLVCDGVGISIDFLTQRMLMFEKGLETSAGKTGNSAKVLESLGISYKNADGTFKTSAELLQSVADWFVTCTDVTERNNIEMLIFNRNGGDLDEMLIRLANHGWQDMIDKAKQWGLAMTPAQIESIKNLSFNFNLLKDSLGGIAAIIGSAFIPWLTTVVNKIGEIITKTGGLIDQAKTVLQALGISFPETPAVTTASGANPAYKRIGTVSGPGSPAVYAVPGPHGEQTGTYGVTTNPPTSGTLAISIDVTQGGIRGGYLQGAAGEANSMFPPTVTLSPLAEQLQRFLKFLQGVNWEKLTTELVTLAIDFAKLAISIVNFLTIIDQWVKDHPVPKSMMSDNLTGIIALMGAGGATGAGIGFILGGPLGSFFGAIAGIIVGGIIGGIDAAVISEFWENPAVKAKMKEIGQIVVDVLSQTFAYIVNGLVYVLNKVIAWWDKTDFVKWDPKLYIAPIMPYGFIPTGGGPGPTSGKKAAGGFLDPGWNLVGEQGYELINSSGYVYNHTISEKLMGGLGAGGHTSGSGTDASAKLNRALDKVNVTMDNLPRSIRDAILQGVQ